MSDSVHVAPDNGSPQNTPTIVRAHSRYAIGLLTIAYVLSFLDRQVMSILAEPIKRDLNLADWQVWARLAASLLIAAEK